MPKPVPADPAAAVEVAVPTTHESHPDRPRAADGFASFAAAVRYLNEHANFERARPTRIPADAFRLDRMGALLETLGDPHRQVRCIHIAGSKGKGSTVEMTASCLEACGYAVGVYTSPHLVDIRERIRINRDLIAPGAFARTLAKVGTAAESIEAQHGPATYFELLTALAFLHFAEQAVDVAVVEVGMGGRLDSTNLIVPEVCAVTAIQLEHTQILGDTLEKIAREKAGIFKPGVPVITIPQTPGVIEVFREVAAAVGAPLEVVGDGIEFSCRFESSPELGPHCRVCLSTPRSNFEHLPVPLKGEHQAQNCGLALAIVDRLRERGFDTPERKVAAGLAKTPNLGRIEQVWSSPRIILDGAHTPDSVQSLVKAIGAHIRYDSMVVVFGCAADKDVKAMLGKIALGADKIIFTRSSSNPRAADPRELQRHFAEISGKMTQVAKTLPDALSLAAQAVGRDDVICVTGSFYLVGEAKKFLADLKAKRNAAESSR